MSESIKDACIEIQTHFWNPNIQTLIFILNSNSIIFTLY